LGVDPADVTAAETQALHSQNSNNSNYSENSHVYQGDWTQTGVQVEQTVEGNYYFVPPARHKGMAVSMSLMALIFGGIGLGLFFFAENRPWIISIVFSLFGVGMLYAALRLWFYRIGFIANRNKLVVREGMFIMKEHSFNSGDIKELTVTSNMSSGDTQYYTIDAETYLGRKVSLAKQLLGKRDVEALRDRLVEELGS